MMALTDQPLQTLKDAISSRSVMAEKWASLAANLGMEMVQILYIGTY